MQATDLHTEPLSVRRLAELFRVGRAKMARILARMDGAEQIEGLWRVPLHRMPPRYLVDVGLLVPREYSAD